MTSEAVNFIRKNWRYAAPGIACKADLLNCRVYHTEVGPIAAWNEEHANQSAKEIAVEIDGKDCAEQKHDLFSKTEI